MRKSIRAALVGIAVASAAMGAAGSEWRILKTWQLGGEGGWDYLVQDPRHRLFVSHGTRVDVLNTETGGIIGTIPDTMGVHGIALADNLNRGFTSNGRANSVTEFDLGTLEKLREVKVPAQNPDAILYEPTGKHVFTFNGRSKDATVLDAATLSVVATLAMPGKPEFAVDDGEGRIFVNIETEAGQMAVIDSRKLSVQAIWSLEGCASPSGLAIDRLRHRLFSVCENKTMVVTDARTGRRVAQLPIGDSSDAAAYDPRRGLVFSSNGEGTLTVIRQESADAYSILATVDTRRGARTMALDTDNGRVYLVTADLQTLPTTPQAGAPSQPHPRPTPVPGSFRVMVVGER